MKIYNYNNEVAEIELSKKPQRLDVTIITGDEVVMVVFEDGTTEQFDSAELTGNQWSYVKI